MFKTFCLSGVQQLNNHIWILDKKTLGLNLR